jgi:hypothetical protein
MEEFGIIEDVEAAAAAPIVGKPIQVGGRLLGAGVYGCTFQPAPRCAGGDVFREIQGMPVVGKVTAEDPRDELTVGRDIMRLPLARQYFALPTEGCKPAMPIEDDDARRCKIMKESSYTMGFSMLVMPAAGEQLLRWSANAPRMAANYERIFIHLLEGMIIYQRAGYVHNDIHMGNVLVDAAGVARYIDFGLAFKIANVRNWEDTNLGHRFSPKHIWQAPEIHAWRMYRNGVRLVDGLRQITDANPEYLRIQNQYPTRKTALAAMTDFLASPYVARTDVISYVRQFGRRIDSWRLGICMWFVWDDMLTWVGLARTPLWERRNLIRRVLGGLTDFDPVTRLEAKEALRILDPTNRIAAA